MLHSPIAILHESVPQPETTPSHVVEELHATPQDIYNSPDVVRVSDVAPYSSVDPNAKYMDTGDYMPPVPQQVSLSDAAYADTFDAVHALGGRPTLEFLLKERHRTGDATPTVLDEAIADEKALRDWDNGRYDKHKFYGQMAQAIKQVWAEGASEHVAYQVGEPRSVHLTPELAARMFELDQTAQLNAARPNRAASDGSIVLEAHWPADSAAAPDNVEWRRTQ